MMVPPDKRIEDAAARLGARSSAERRGGNIFSVDKRWWLRWLRGICEVIGAKGCSYYA